MEKVCEPKKTDIIKWFESMGYKFSWDFSKSDNLFWYEFRESDSGKLVVQIEAGITKERFLKEFWSCDKDDEITFFIAGKENSNSWKILSLKINNELKRERENEKNIISKPEHT